MTEHLTDEARRKGQEAKSLLKNVSGILKNALSGLPARQKAQVGARLEEMPVTFRGRYIRAMLGKTPTTAIEAHCYECIGWNRGDVGACTALACSLYPYRPEQGGEGSNA